MAVIFVHQILNSNDLEILSLKYDYFKLTPELTLFADVGN